jgi:hypothetical protein
MHPEAVGERRLGACRHKIARFWQPLNIPSWLLRVPRLRPSDAVVWAVLDCRQRDKDECWPSVATIAADAGVCPDTVNTSIKRLEAHGLLSVKRRFGEENHYTTHLPKNPAGSGGDGGQDLRRSEGSDLPKNP